MLKKILARMPINSSPSLKKRRGLAERRSGFLPFSSQEKGPGDEFSGHQKLFT